MTTTMTTTMMMMMAVGDEQQLLLCLRCLGAGASERPMQMWLREIAMAP